MFLLKIISIASSSSGAEITEALVKAIASELDIDGFDDYEELAKMLASGKLAAKEKLSDVTSEQFENALSQYYTLMAGGVITRGRYPF